MKKSTFIFTLIVFISISFSGISQQSKRTRIKQLLTRTIHPVHEINSNAKAAKYFTPDEVLFSRPGNSEDYNWNSGDNTWIQYSNSEYTYNETGDLLERLSTEANTGVNLMKNTWAYDMYGNMTEYVFYYWYGESWEITDGYKYIYTYDNNGHITVEIFQYWDYNTNAWLNSYKTISTYNNDGYLIEEIGQEWDYDSWVNDWKDSFTLNTSGEPIEVFISYWDIDEWINEDKYTDVVWHNWEKEQLQSYVQQYYYSGVWINIERLNATYSGDNSVEVYEYWNGSEWENEYRDTFTKTTTEEIWTYEYWDNENWVYSDRYTDFYDEYGNLTAYKYEYWDNGQWVLDYAYISEHTYNNDGEITETVEKYWDSYTMSYENSARYVYSNFFYFESGITNKNSLNNVQIYPNPVKSTVHIRIDELDISNYQVDIMDITGKTLFRNTYSNLSNSINLDYLEKGIYLLRISTDDDRLFNYKILKE